MTNKEREVNTIIEKEKNKTDLPSIYYEEIVQDDWCKRTSKTFRVSGETSNEAYETFKKVKKDLKCANTEKHQQ